MEMTPSETEKQDAARVNKAEQMLRSGNGLGAKELLLQVTKNAPSPEQYVYQHEEDNVLHIKFWNLNEYLHYVTWKDQIEGMRKNVTWIPSAYPRAFYCLGFISLEEDDPLAAIKYLDKGAMLEPTNPKFKLEKAEAYGRLKDFQSALNLYGQVAELSPHVGGDDLAQALRGTGSTLIEWGELDLAEAAFRESLRYDPKSSVAANELAYIARLRQGGQKTKMRLTTTGGMDPRTCANCGRQFESGQAHNFEGRMIYLCEECHGILTTIGDADTSPSPGDLEAAEREAREAIARQPDSADAWFNLGMILDQQGRDAHAEQSFRHGLTLTPAFAPAWVYLGATLYKQHRLHDAEQAIRRATQLQPIDIYGWSLLGGILLEQHRDADAEQALRNAVQLDPDDGELLVNLGLALQRQNRAADAEEVFRKATQRQPQLVRAWVALGDLLTDQDRPTEAEQAYRQAIKLRPDNAETWLGLGRVLIKQGRFKEAAAARQRATELGARDGRKTTP